VLYACPWRGIPASRQQSQRLKVAGVHTAAGDKNNIRRLNVTDRQSDGRTDGRTTYVAYR